MNVFLELYDNPNNWTDPATGYLYHIADYNRTRRNGNKPKGILVTDSTGKNLGYISEQKFLKLLYKYLPQKDKEKEKEENDYLAG